MPWMNISCPKCGQTNSLESWTERTITGPLPIGQYQCPNCQHAFQRRSTGPATMWTAPNGNQLFFREKIELRTCSAVM